VNGGCQDLKIVLLLITTKTTSTSYSRSYYALIAPMLSDHYSNFFIRSLDMLHDIWRMRHVKRSPGLVFVA
jgi:hypothetical protein